MKKSDFNENYFDAIGYDQPIRFSDNQYILCVRDLENRSNVIPIFYYDYGRIQLVDPEKIGDRIKTVKNEKINMAPIYNRIDEFELVKISTSVLIENSYREKDPDEPIVRIFHTCVSQLANHEIIEIFDGKLNEENSSFTLKNEELDNLIVTRYEKLGRPFFIEENDNIIGPFKFNRISTNGDLIISQSDEYEFGKYVLSKQDFYEFEVNNVVRKIIINPDLENLFDTKETFITNDELINRFKGYAEKYPEDFNPKQLTELLEFLKRSKSIDFIGESDKTKERIIKLISSQESSIVNFLDVGSFITELGTIKEEIKTLSSQKLDLTNLIKDQIKDKESNEESIAELEQELRSLSEKFKEQHELKKKELETAVASLQEKKENLDEEIEEIKIGKLAEVEGLESVIGHLNKKKESLEYALKTLNEQFTSEQKASHEKLKELLIANQHYNIISGRNFDEKSSNEFSMINFTSESILTDPKDKLKVYNSLRTKILDILERNNRKFEPHFIDNILISIFQNTLTLFAGLPGTGKTSLVKILTKILTDERRIREVSVGRGWTSQKDLIGFYNPLSNTFNPSSTDIYNLLLQLNDESINSKYLDSPMAFVLLDEANLSPLEHYWSSFYNLTDSQCQEGVLLSLNLGKDINLNYPNNLRFIGTINYDQTTEELSPRVIDRANIIKMSSKNFEIDSILNGEIESLKLSFRDCIHLFDLPDFNQSEIALKWQPNVETVFNEIKSKLESIRIYISPRVIIAIKRYYLLAITVMVDQNKPLDYCIAQRILPLINLNGENAKIKLEELLKIFEDYNLKISAKILEDIIKNGSEGEVFQDSFNFFISL